MVHFKKPKKLKSWHVYILLCSDGSLYTGVTTDLKRRFKEHLEGLGARYTRSRKPKKIVYSEKFAARGKALSREYQIKQLPHQLKKNLIAKKKIRKMSPEKNKTARISR